MSVLMRTPRSLDLEITSRCNASCNYCYYLNNDGVNYTDLPTERWLGFFQELADGAVMNVTLQGGEPLLRDDFFTLIDGIVANRMRFSVLTNGRLLTREVAERLQGSGRCDRVQVSLDGSCATIHEQSRGTGSFAPAVDAIQNLQAVGVPVTVRVTVNPANVDDLPRLAELLLEEIGLPSFSTNAASALGSRDKYSQGTLLRPLERLRAMRVLAGLDRRYPGRIHANAGPLADWRMFQEMELARRDKMVIPGRGRLVGCGCVFDKLAVRADGVYVPCVMLPTMVLGTIGREPLSDVWREASVLRQMRERHAVNLELFLECRDCPWRESCTGNCAGTALAATGSFMHPCPATCLKNFQSSLEDVGESLWNAL